MRAARKRVSKQITQYRKDQGLTFKTSSQAATIIAKLREELTAAEERVGGLEAMNELLQSELDSIREHEEVLGSEESDSPWEGFGSDEEDADVSAADLTIPDASADPSEEGDLFPLVLRGR
jgi:hypothetical protein